MVSSGLSLFFPPSRTFVRPRCLVSSAASLSLSDAFALLILLPDSLPILLCVPAIDAENGLLVALRFTGRAIAKVFHRCPGWAPAFRLFNLLACCCPANSSASIPRGILCEACGILPVAIDGPLMFPITGTLEEPAAFELPSSTENSSYELLEAFVVAIPVFHRFCTEGPVR